MEKVKKTKIIGVDTGGTFTDRVSVDLKNKKRFIRKVLSKPDDPSIAFMNSLEDQDLNEIIRLSHGTTHATNTIITKTGAITGVITTMGFRDTIEIMRGNRPYDNVYNLQWRKGKHLVPRYLRVEVNERLDYKGDEIEPLNEKEVIKAAKFLVDKEVNSIAICFIFSYMNPSHENRAAELIKKKFPDVFVSTSSSILPEWREYERFSTTVCDAYVKPKISSYFLNIEKKVEGKSYFGNVLIMKNNGGVMSSKMARETPIETCLSGPAAGVVGGKYFAERAGFGNVITTDMGGTSFDVSLIYNGEYSFTTETEIAEGIPIKAPMVDIRTIGAGGGSIGWVDSGGALRVGPQSASADPGPVCYGTGGIEPTITDANLILGRLNPDYFIGGEKVLDKELSKKAILKLSKELNLDVIEVSKGIITASTANMVNEIRTITTENGYDPRDFILLSAGGAGPLQGVQIAKELKIKKVIVPPFPGIMSAIGLLLSDLKFDSVKTYHVLLSKNEMIKIRDISKNMIIEGISLLKSEGFEGEPICIISLDMRYLGQNYEINLQVENDKFNYSDICDRFDEEHKRLYGVSLPGIPREILRIRTSVLGIIGNKFEILDAVIVPNNVSKKGGHKEIYKCKRSVYTDEEEKPLECLIFERDDLYPGFKVSGPIIIEEIDSTIFVPPYCEAEVDNYMNIIININ